MTTTTTGDSMTGNKTFASAVIGWALVVVLLVVGGAGVSINLASINTSNAAATAQADTIATLAAEKAALTERLDVCLKSFDTQKSNAAADKETLDKISAKWGVNYRISVKDLSMGYDNATAALVCN